MSLQNPLGLIAGNGQFPILVAQEARKEGRAVVAVAIPDETDPALQAHTDLFQWMPLGQIKKTIQHFKANNVAEAVMAGQVKHVKIFKNLKLDLTAMKILATVPNRKTDTILGAIAAEFEKSGVKLLSSIAYLKNYLAGEGVLTKTKPSKEDREDIAFGFETAKALGGIDVGQTVCVKEKTVLAVEAMEGTDACIERAGAICGGAFTVVKTAKPKQDLRFDVPVIGLKTLASLMAARARVLAVEADKTLFFDREAFLSGADAAGIVVVGVKA